MRIHNDKKQNLFLSFEKLLKTKTSIFFISVTQLTIKEKILLKNEFEKFGLKFIVVKNKVFTKQIGENFPELQNLIPLVQGFCIALYPLDSREQATIEDLKQLGTFLDKQPNLLFLGGLFEKKLINQTFLNELLKLKSSEIIYQNIINLITLPQRNVFGAVQRTSTNLQFMISNINKVDK